jgi:hypothetical protein
MEPLEPLPSLEPPPSLSPRRKRIASWAIAIALLSALVGGIMRALDSNLLEGVRTYLGLH